MIKLMTNYFDEPINVEKMTVLVLEDPKVFSKISQSIYIYEEDNSELKIFNQKQDNLKKSDVLTIIDIIGFNLNSTSFLKILYSDLEKQIKENTEIRSELEKLFFKLEVILRDEIVDFELNLNINSMDLLTLFKAMGIKALNDENSIYEKLTDIIEISSYLGKRKLLVFINALSFLTEKEIKEIREYISLNVLDVLFIEPRKINGLKQYYCDKDYLLFQDMI